MSAVTQSRGSIYTVSSSENSSLTRQSSTAHPAQAHEGISTTIRCLPTDFSQKMLEMQARGNALERYKVLIQSARAAPPPREVPLSTVSSRGLLSNREADLHDDVSSLLSVSDVSDTSLAATTQNASATAVDGRVIKRTPARRMGATAKAQSAISPQRHNVNKQTENCALTASPRMPGKNRAHTTINRLMKEERAVASTRLQSLSTNIQGSPSGPSSGGVIIKEISLSPMQKKDSSHPSRVDCPLHYSSGFPCSETNSRPSTAVTAKSDVVDVPEILAPELTVPVVRPPGAMRDAIKPNFDPVTDSTSRSRTATSSEGAPPRSGRTSNSGGTGLVPDLDLRSERVTVGGGYKASFWVRPASARYGPTESISAKKTTAAASAAEHLERLDPRPPFSTMYSARRTAQAATQLSSRSSRRTSENALQSSITRSKGRLSARESTEGRRSTRETTTTPSSWCSSTVVKKSKVTSHQFVRSQSARSTGCRSIADMGPEEEERVASRQSQSFMKHCRRLSRVSSSDVSESILADEHCSSQVVKASRFAAHSTRRSLHAARPLSASPEVSKRLHFDAETAQQPPVKESSIDPHPAMRVPRATPKEPITMRHSEMSHQSNFRDEAPSASSVRTPRSSSGKRVLAGTLREGIADASSFDATPQGKSLLLERVASAPTAASARRTTGQLGATGCESSTTIARAAVAGMLQGIVQQTRRVLPCYLCAEMQSVGAYHLHLDLCRPRSEALFEERHVNTAPLRAIEQKEIPTMSCSEAQREAFTADCYACAKALLVPCTKCGGHVRVHDAKEHELLCGRSYYDKSKAAERLRSTVDRIQAGTKKI